MEKRHCHMMLASSSMRDIQTRSKTCRKITKSCRFGMTSGRKVSGFIRKIIYTTKHCGSTVIGYKAFTLDFRFKISGDATKPGCFYFGFTHLCVNEKTNLVPKCSGFRHKSGKISSSVNVVLTNTCSIESDSRNNTFY